jgi:F-type H+-transporting ATPase subunit epsilon
MSLTLKVVTPEKEVLAASVEAVSAIGTNGSFGVLTHHQPLVTALEIGLLTYTQGAQKKALAVMGGVFSTDGTTVTVLTPSAELGEQIDVLRAQEAKARAEARLKEKESHIDHQRAQLALNRAIIRLKAAGKA